MATATRQGLLLGSIVALFVAGIAGASIHDDDDSPGSAAGGSETASPTSTTSATPSRAMTPNDTAPGTAQAPTDGSAGTEGPGSGLGASGIGRAASGTEPLADTGPPALTAPALVLLALAAASRLLGRRSRPAQT